MKIPRPEELRAHHDERWAELDQDIKIKAMAAVRCVSTKEDVDKIKKAYAKNPATWWTPYHFYWGMKIRNKIRTLARVLDDQLPSGNWDDYYVPAVEAAFGLRPMI